MKTDAPLQGIPIPEIGESLKNAIPSQGIPSPRIRRIIENYNPAQGILLQRCGRPWGTSVLTPRGFPGPDALAVRILFLSTALGQFEVHPGLAGPLSWDDSGRGIVSLQVGLLPEPSQDRFRTHLLVLSTLG